MRLRSRLWGLARQMFADDPHGPSERRLYSDLAAAEREERRASAIDAAERGIVPAEVMKKISVSTICDRGVDAWGDSSVVVILPGRQGWYWRNRRQAAAVLAKVYELDSDTAKVAAGMLQRKIDSIVGGGSRGRRMRRGR